MLDVLQLAKTEEEEEDLQVAKGKHERAAGSQGCDVEINKCYSVSGKVFSGTVEKS